VHVGDCAVWGDAVQAAKRRATENINESQTPQ
jgi:hypothetical protein